MRGVVGLTFAVSSECSGTFGFRIKFIDCPIMIMHAKDDRVIPFTLAEKVSHSLIRLFRGHSEMQTFPQLRDVALDHDKDVTFVAYEAELGYGHKYICNSADFLGVSTWVCFLVINYRNDCKFSRQFFDKCLANQKSSDSS